MRARAVVWLLVGAVLLTTAASAQAHAHIGLGAALERHARPLGAMSTPASRRRPV
jgi:hypothetical protein